MPSHNQPDGDIGLRGLLGALTTALSDLQFETLITTRMLPAVYGLVLAFSALFSIYLVGNNFSHSWQRGVLWLLVLGPATFFALTIAARIVLEFVLTVFRIAVQVQFVTERTQEIGGIAEDIATDLPRIQFWRTRRRKEN